MEKSNRGMEGRLKVSFLSVHRHSQKSAQGMWHGVELITSNSVGCLCEVLNSSKTCWALLTDFWVISHVGRTKKEMG